VNFYYYTELDYYLWLERLTDFKFNTDSFRTNFRRTMQLYLGYDLKV
jgi:hypothetical protein